MNISQEHIDLIQKRLFDYEQTCRDQAVELATAKAELKVALKAWRFKSVLYDSEVKENIELEAKLESANARIKELEAERQNNMPAVGISSDDE